MNRQYFNQWINTHKSIIVGPKTSNAIRQAGWNVPFGRKLHIWSKVSTTVPLLISVNCSTSETTTTQAEGVKKGYWIMIINMETGLGKVPYTFIPLQHVYFKSKQQYTN